MKETVLSLPEVMMIGATRAVGGAGIGLLLADKLSKEQRRAVGWTLLLVGVLSTAPLLMIVLGKSK